MTNAIESLRNLPDVALQRPLEREKLEDLNTTHGFQLPSEHEEILLASNGLETYSGFFRLFGIGPCARIDSIYWNAHNCWKFAWRDSCNVFWCFAETAWGDQFAYSLDALRKRGPVEVFFLDAITMTPRKACASFSEFVEGSLNRSASGAGFDQLTKAVRQKLGHLDVSSHIAIVPSLLLGGPEHIDNVRVLPARESMIINGDIACQLHDTPTGAEVIRIEPYTDSESRMRMRIILR